MNTLYLKRKFDKGENLSREEIEILFGRLEQETNYLDRIGRIKKDKSPDESMKEVTTILSDRYRALGRSEQKNGLSEV